MSLPITCRVGRPPLVEPAVLGAETHGRDVVDERVEPDVDDAGRIVRQRDTPELAGTADRDVVESPLEQPQNLVAPVLGQQELRVPLEVLQQRRLVLREPEEMVALADQLGWRAMHRAPAIHQILLRLESLARHAVRSLVEAVVQISPVGNAPDHLGHGHAVARFRCPDEVIERDVEPGPDLPELPLHPVAVGERVETGFAGAAEHVLRVLVVAHQEMGVHTLEALVPCNDVRGDLLVRRPEVGAAVDEVNRRRQIEA